MTRRGKVVNNPRRLLPPRSSRQEPNGSRAGDAAADRESTAAEITAGRLRCKRPLRRKGRRILVSGPGVTRAPPSSASCLVALGAVSVLSRSHVTISLATLRRRSFEPERFCEPATAALLQESFGLRSGDVSRHEHDPTRHLGWRQLELVVELRAVGAGASSRSRMIRSAWLLRRPLERLQTAARAVHPEPESWSDSATAAPSAASSSTTRIRRRPDHRGRRILRRRQRVGLREPASAGSSTENVAPPARLRFQRDPSAAFLDDRVGDASGRGRCPLPTSFVVKNGSKILPAARSSRHAGSVVADLEHDGSALEVMPVSEHERAASRCAAIMACSALMIRLSRTCCTWW